MTMKNKANSKILEALYSANGVMRSMYQIAAREGRDTNWGPFIKALEKELQVQHEIMYPDRYFKKKK
jgi:hypothetical protein